ncbi:hypothetical protein [Roseovarius rhodophyticola]|uniref:RxLR effector protein n=1 Tax=Roseovarius rhodophyticola TaxID=3080827 RepID=A0ABZ2TN20_9RHOB|nr:hypothetical protein [Roseovarius sp. W115]MDV2929510.1 hypothetical protein [Roseovarius sp. W115]
MRTLTAIVLTAVLATPAAALSIVKVMTDSTPGSELSVQEREDQFSKLKSRGGSKSKKGRAPLFDTVRNTQIG